jgi:hypothetical protein
MAMVEEWLIQLFQCNVIRILITTVIQASTIICCGHFTYKHQTAERRMSLSSILQWSGATGAKGKRSSVEHEIILSSEHMLTGVHTSLTLRDQMLEGRNTYFSDEKITLSQRVTNSQVLFHDGSLLHSQFNTQLLITVHNSSRILIHAQLPLVF